MAINLCSLHSLHDVYQKYQLIRKGTRYLLSGGMRDILYILASCMKLFLIKKKLYEWTKHVYSICKLSCLNYFFHCWATYFWRIYSITALVHGHLLQGYTIFTFCMSYFHLKAGTVINLEEAFLKPNPDIGEYTTLLHNNWMSVWFGNLSLLQMK